MTLVKDWGYHDMRDRSIVNVFRADVLKRCSVSLAMTAVAVASGGCAARQFATVEKDGFEVVYHKAVPKATGDKAIVIMPPTGGSTRLDGLYRNLFRRAGFSVYVVESWSGMDEVVLELDLHNRLLGRGQAAIDLLLEQVVEPFVAIFGTSVGGIHALTALGRVDRLAAGVVVGSAHPVASVIAWSEQKDLKALRDQRMREFGWSTIDAYETALLATVHVEPACYREALMRKALGAVVIGSDNVVPTRLQLAVVSDFDAEPVHRVSGNHLPGIVRAYWFHGKDTRDFFLEAYQEWRRNVPQREAQAEFEGM